VQNILSSSWLSRNIKIKIYRTIILPVVLYGCETWSFIRREERRLRVFENRVLSRILVTKSDEVTGDWKKNCIIKSFSLNEYTQVRHNWSTYGLFHKV